MIHQQLCYVDFTCKIEALIFMLKVEFIVKKTAINSLQKRKWPQEGSQQEGELKITWLNQYSTGVLAIRHTRINPSGPQKPITFSPALSMCLSFRVCIHVQSQPSNILYVCNQPSQSWAILVDFVILFQRWLIYSDQCPTISMYYTVNISFQCNFQTLYCILYTIVLKWLE